MQTLITRAARIAAILTARGQTVAIAESSSGGLISAALLAIPGASKYFRGGSVNYTRKARATYLGITKETVGDMRSSTEPYAVLLAETTRSKLTADWGLGESGAAGPGGNPYGDASGHTCIAVAGKVALHGTIENGSEDRVANMIAFAEAGLDLLEQALNMDDHA